MRIDLIFMIHKQIVFKTIFNNVDIKFMFQVSFNLFFLTISIIIVSSLNEMFLKMINIMKVSLCFILINLIKRYNVKNCRISRNHI